MSVGCESSVLTTKSGVHGASRFLNRIMVFYTASGHSMTSLCMRINKEVTLTSTCRLFSRKFKFLFSSGISQLATNVRVQSGLYLNKILERWVYFTKALPLVVTILPQSIASAIYEPCVCPSLNTDLAHQYAVQLCQKQAFSKPVLKIHEPQSSNAIQGVTLNLLAVTSNILAREQGKPTILSIWLATGDESERLLLQHSSAGIYA